MRSLIVTFGRCGWGWADHAEYPTALCGWFAVSWTKGSLVKRLLAAMNRNEWLQAKLEGYEKSLSESRWSLEKREALAETRQLHLPEPEDPQQVLPIGPGPALDDLAEELAAIVDDGEGK